MRKPNPPNFVSISIVTTVTIIFWVFISVYSELTQKLDYPVPPEILAPVTPQLDTATLDELEKSIYFESDPAFSLSGNSNIDPVENTQEEADIVIDDEENTATSESDLDQ